MGAEKKQHHQHKHFFFVILAGNTGENCVYEYFFIVNISHELRTLVHRARVTIHCQNSIFFPNFIK